MKLVSAAPASFFWAASPLQVAVWAKAPVALSDRAAAMTNRMRMGSSGYCWTRHRDQDLDLFKSGAPCRPAAGGCAGCGEKAYVDPPALTRERFHAPGV